jgi:hypothetical protein
MMLSKLWGRMPSCAPVGNRRFRKRVTNPTQVSNLPHQQ